jgi:hypothetical protein
MHDERYDLFRGDLVEIYSPLSMYHGHYALVVDGPNVYGVYKILIQENLEVRSYGYSELERIN